MIRLTPKNGGHRDTFEFSLKCITGFKHKYPYMGVLGCSVKNADFRDKKGPNMTPGTQEWTPKT